MEKKEEAWLKKIQERLDDYSAPLPSAGWERLETDLPARHTTRKLVPLHRRWTALVAALVAGVLVFIGFRLLYKEPQNMLPADDVRPTLTADALPVPPPVDARLPQTQGVARRTPISADRSVPFVQTASDIPEDKMIEDNKKEKKEVKEYNRKKEERGKKKTTFETESSLLALADNPHRLDTPKGWSIGLSAGNTGGFGDSGSSLLGSYPLQDGALGSGYVNIDLAATSNGIITIPEGQELVFKNGIPYLQSTRPELLSADHKQPVSVGFTVRKALPRHFSLETGLVYTYLASDLLYAGATGEVRQKLHYLGIPLRANWSFIDRKDFNLYVSAGGMMEKCIYGKIGTENVAINPLQWSVMASVGAQYNLSRRVGIYVEPGVSYYFDDGSDICTIRKDNPFNFTLQAGLRLSY